MLFGKDTKFFLHLALSFNKGFNKLKKFMEFKTREFNEINLFSSAFQRVLAKLTQALQFGVGKYPPLALTSLIKANILSRILLSAILQMSGTPISDVGTFRDLIVAMISSALLIRLSGILIGP